MILQEKREIAGQAAAMTASLFVLVESVFGASLPESEFETTLNEARALDMLGRKEFWTMSEFAREQNVTLSTASHTVERLVRKRAVKRCKAPHDRRLVLISLSGKGLKRQESIVRNRVVILTQILEKLTSAERHGSVSMLHRLAELALEGAGRKTENLDEDK